MTFNKDKLIRMIYERPVVWNHKHVEYRSGVLKQRAWLELAKEFQTTDGELKRKWSCIRDTFRREMRKILKLSTETEPYVSKWPYFEKMLFLKDTMDARKSFIYGAEEEEVDVLEDNSTTELVDTSLDKDEVKISSSDVHYSFRTFPLILPKSVPVLADPLSINASDLRKRSVEKAGLETEQEESPKGKKLIVATDDDEDYHFVMSILPSLRKVSNKMKVRMDIMNIIATADRR